MEKRYYDSDPKSEYGHISMNHFKVNPNPNTKFWVADDF